MFLSSTVLYRLTVVSKLSIIQVLAFLQLNGEADQATAETESSLRKKRYIFSQIYSLLLFTVVYITSAWTRKDLDITAPELKAANY